MRLVVDNTEKKDLSFADWWKETNEALVARGDGDFEVDYEAARYWFQFGYDPETAARRIGDERAYEAWQDARQ